MAGRQRDKKILSRPMFLDPWLWQMAWRDSRSNRGRLLLFMSAIVLGVAALVAISSFGDNLKSAVQDQAKSILGADLLLFARQPFSVEDETLIDSLGGAQAREVSFASMAYFPESGGTRLVQVRGLGEGFPFYGTIDTTPAEAGGRFRSQGGALVDQSLMIQYNLQVGDSVKIGASFFPVTGRLDKAPGQNDASAAIAPRIYISLDDIEKTQLIRFGSRVFYRVYFRFDDGRDVNQLREELKPYTHENRLSILSSDSRSRNLGDVMDDLYGFLNLVAFIALLLGGIGVASAVHVYIRQKLATAAILRCCGAKVHQTLAIFLIQTGVMGLVGALAGAALGVFIQLYLPELFRDFLVVDIAFTLSPAAIFKGLATGFGMTLLFALLPLLSIRDVSPLLALRVAYEPRSSLRDPVRLLTVGIILLAILSFAVYQTGSFWRGLSFALGVFVAFAVLAGVAQGLILLVRRFFPENWQYELRQSMANLFRPENQTLILIAAIGLGVFQIGTLYLIQNSLLNQIRTVDAAGQPNMILFDIQVDQKEAVEELVRGQNLSVIQTAPIISLRLATIKGRRVSELRADSTNAIPAWALVREYRVTYRDTLNDTETIVAGEWRGEAEPGAGVLPLSLGSDLAEDLQVGLGDTLGLDVQGVELPAVVTSLRDINWQRVQPNFFMLFPRNTLEAAPQIYVVVTRTPDADAAAQLQRAMVQAFPNVSSVDTTLIIRTVQDILGRVAFIIRFMALFSIFTGLIVLTAAVITTRFQRTRESVLLRTLGARTAQIRLIIGVEYLLLGFLSAVTGVGLALAATWALSIFVFKNVFVPDIAGLLLIGAGITLLTGLLGVANSRGIATRSPLEILRAEG